MSASRLGVIMFDNFSHLFFFFSLSSLSSAFFSFHRNAPTFRSFEEKVETLKVTAG